MLIRPALLSDKPAVDKLLDACFGPARHNRTASLLRRGAAPVDGAAYVAEDTHGLLGSVAVHRLWWTSPDGFTQPIAWLGPLVSHPDRRGEGIGLELMDSALASLDRMDMAVALIGDEPYYRRWGFMAQATQGWTLPGPVDYARLLLRARNHSLFEGVAQLQGQPRTARAA